MRFVALSVTVVLACTGDSKIEKWTALPGAPNANWALDFDHQGRPIAAGGQLIFSEQYIQRERPSEPGVWERAAGMGPGQGGGSFWHTTGDKLVANLSDRRLFRLDDEANFTWTALDNPLTDLTYLLGSDPSTGRFYGAINTPGAPTIDRWSAGEQAWTPLAGSGLIAGTVTNDSVAGHGALYVVATASDQRSGIWRLDDTGTNLVVDCNDPDFLYCGSPPSALTLAPDGTLYFVSFAETVVHDLLLRLRPGASHFERVTETPKQYPRIGGLQVVGDSLYLVAAQNNLESSAAAIFRLDLGDTSWTQITSDDPDNFVEITDPVRFYRVRDSSTIFGAGNGYADTGIVQGSF